MIRVDVDAARAAGAEQLVELGFTALAGGTTWGAPLDPTSGVSLVVTLPRGFPYELPIVHVERSKLGGHIPHVDRHRRVCIASAEGLVLDASRPKAVVQEAIARARDIVGIGLRGENAVDLQREFSAYWETRSARTLLSFCDVQGAPRVIALGAVANGRSSPAFVAADAPDRLRTIVARLGIKLRAVERAWFIRLRSPILPPNFDAEVELGFVGTLIRDHVDSEYRGAVERWLNADQTRLTFLFSFQVEDGRGDAVFAMRLTSQVPSNGFRPGKIPLSVAIARSGSERAERFDTQRGDADFLRSRTGSIVDLMAKKVLVVGCGAVGGYLATCLADSGVGHLTLVDPDNLNPENAMRHVLGLSPVSSPKVEALKKFIQSRLPHVEVDARAMRLEDALAKEPDLARRHDVVVLATGDQSLELRMSESMRHDARLVHAWVEAHGVGGHVLVDGQTAKGCLGCLWLEDNVFGLRCPASLYAPGQSFTATVGGCAGTFTPFGSLDAQRAAIEASRVAIRVLQGEIESSTLVSWFETKLPFEKLKLQPSDRARHMVPGSRVETTAHAGCPRCAP